MDRLPRWGFRSRGLDDQWPPEQSPAPWWAVLISKQGLASGLFRPGGMAFEPGRWGKGTPETDKELGHADGVLPGQILGDPVCDQGVAEPSAEGFGGRPSTAWLI